MKSLYDSRPEAPCPLCGLPWARGEAIAKWLGDWVHEECKAAESHTGAVTVIEGEVTPNKPVAAGAKGLIRESRTVRPRTRKFV